MTLNLALIGPEAALLGEQAPGTGRGPAGTPTGPEGWYQVTAGARSHNPPLPAPAGLLGPASLVMGPPRAAGWVPGIALPLPTHPYPTPSTPLPVHPPMYQPDHWVHTAGACTYGRF